MVVALNGVAAGAGASIALMGDITVAARSASLTFLFAPKLGLAPDGPLSAGDLEGLPLPVHVFDDQVRFD